MTDFDDVARGDDPARSRSCLRPRPTAFAAVVEAFETAVIDIVSGDVDAARRTLAGVDDGPVVDWYEREVLLEPIRAVGAPEPGERSRRQPRRRRRSELERWWRHRRVPPRTVADIVDRDHSRCRYCGSALVQVRHLLGVQRVVGADVLPGVDRRRGKRGLGAVWLLTCGTVDRVRLGRGGGYGPANLVASCIPCRDGRRSRPLGDLGLADPRRRPPDDPPSWLGILDALDLPATQPRALVRRALLLDGATLNLGGVLHGPVDAADELHVDARVEGATWRAPIEVLRAAPGAVEFQAHICLDRLLVGAAPPAAVDVCLSDRRGADVVMVPAPGCERTPNADVVEPVPVVPGARRRLRLDLRRGVVVRTDELAVEVEVAAVRQHEDAIHLRLEPDPAGAAEVTSVWVQPRESAAGEDRQLLSAVDGEWSLVPDATLVAGRPSDGVLWDVWVECTVDGVAHIVRAGRRRSDLRSLRESAVLPTSRSTAGELEVKLVPYFTGTRHLAVKVRAAARSSEAP